MKNRKHKSVELVRVCVTLSVPEFDKLNRIARRISHGKRSTAMGYIIQDFKFNESEGK